MNEYRLVRGKGTHCLSPGFVKNTSVPVGMTGCGGVLLKSEHFLQVQLGFIS